MMSKNAKRKILTAAVLCACTTLYVTPVWAVELEVNSWEQFEQMKENGDFDDVKVERGIAYKPATQNNNNKITINVQDNIPLIGSDIAAGMGNGNTLVINGGIFGEKGASSIVNPDKSSSVYGSVGSEIAENNTVEIYDGIFYQDVYGARVSGTNVSAKLNKVNIYGGVVNGSVYGGNLTNSGTVENNSILITKDAEVNNVYGGDNGYSVINNTIEITGSAKVANVYGGRSTEDNAIVSGNIITISDTAKITGLLYGGYSSYGFSKNNRVIVKANSEMTGNSSRIYGGYSVNGQANNNYIEISGGTINGMIYGGYGATANGNNVVLSSGKIKDWKEVYGGYDKNSDEIEVNNNVITLTNDIDIAGAILYGSNKDIADTKGNTLIIDSWKSNNANGNVVYNVKNFNSITFKGLEWENNGIVLNITNASSDGTLSGAKIDVNNLTLTNDKKLQAGDKMTFIQSNRDTGLSLDNVTKTEDISIAQGVATVGKMDMSIDGETNNLVGEIKSTALNDQTKLVAENRAVAAAFINQGTDLIADSLDTISRDGKYGIKTFAAVHGNRSKYDVNSDLKINGWSTIVGVGAENEHHGGDFSWGVFYENGSGNYRTYNEFNNEFFRGDGSLVYNGGGIAARYENAHGVYTEGSLRAGMLKSEMTDALSDGENKYGYKSESEYYGAHIGIGQIIPLSESSDLDVYGKFFHTYTEGDSFNVAGDEFEFDSINSDRLRVGARLTINKENKFSTYYGLAYEYEFNGDAEMRAAGMDAPTQSLQGSSYMAEIGLNYQPTPDSPWSFDLNMRGYAGEREGATFNVQATYTF